MNWHYVEGGKQAGPVDEAELRMLMRQGRIHSETLVWHEGMVNWQPFSYVEPPGWTVGVPPAVARAPVPLPIPAHLRKPAPLLCTKCRGQLTENILNLPDLAPCPACGALLQVEIFPAFLRLVAPGRQSETIIVEGESSCFYHPQKRAVIPCEVCGRFLCALCDCEVQDQHLCPGCLESGQKKKSIRGLEDTRVLHSRQALTLAILPLFLTGLAAIYVSLRYRKVPGSLVQPMQWAFAVALIVGSLQTLGFLVLFLYAFR